MTAAPVRVFVSTGEASGELLAAELIGAMRARGVALDADGIGGERLEAAGVRLTQRSAGWASMGPLDALAKIPKLLAVALRIAVTLRAHPRDLIVLVDFGAFNLAARADDSRARVVDADPVLFSAGGVARRRRPGARGRGVVRSADRVRASARLLSVVGLADQLRRASAGLDDRAAPAAPARAARRRRGRALARQPRAARSRATRRACSTRSRCCANGGRRSPPCSRPSIPPRTRRSKSSCACGRRYRCGWCVRRAKRWPCADAAAVASGTAVLEAALLEVPDDRALRAVGGDGEDRAARLPRALHHAAEPGARRAGRARTAAGRRDAAARWPTRSERGARRTGRTTRRFPPCARRARHRPTRSSAARASRSAPGRTMIRIYHTSDLHDRRHIAAPLRRLRAERPGLLVDCGDSLRGSQTVYRSPRTDRRRTQCGGVRRHRDGESRIPLPLRFGRPAVAQTAPAGRVREPDRRARPHAAVCADALLRAQDGEAVRFFGLLVPQYPHGSPWERRLRLALSRSGRGRDRDRAHDAARRHARRALASRTCAPTASWPRACRSST